jgi:CheY-like chemotaxis protein
MLAKHALIVDDSQTARAVLKHQLNQFDVIVESASDGSHALEMLRNHIPDVIFLDHIMPGLDGFQVLRLLKENQTTRGIPVVMYTSQAATQYTSEAKSLGAIGVIPKKVTNEQLMQVLDRAELYRYQAVNADQHSPPGSAPNEAGADASGQAVASPVIPIKRSQSTRGGQVQGAVDQPAAALAAEVAKERSVSGFEQPANTRFASLRGHFATLLLALLVFAQGYALVRDQQQQQTIVGLQQRFHQQEQQLLLAQEQFQRQEQQLQQTTEQMAAQQRELTQDTWRQFQFVVDILVEQLKNE